MIDDLAGIVRDRSALGRRIQVPFEIELAPLVDVVGVDLDLVLLCARRRI
jgi:hypothetical protein